MTSSVIFVNRKNTDCAKWDGLKDRFSSDNLQAMWVADMDFKSPECVISAIKEYVQSGVFGYYLPPESYLNAFLDWEKDVHNFILEKEWIRYSIGVVPAINWLIQFLTKPNDSIIVQTPVYYPFLDAVNRNNRKLICSDLVVQNGIYSIDFEKFEHDIIDNNVRLFILCSPHNPVGRVWKYDELKQLLDICQKHHVYVISDEIHQDIVHQNHKHLPSASIGNYNDFLITLTSASKTFNIAAYQNAFVIIPNDNIRKQYDEFLNAMRLRCGTSIGYIATEAAYRHGRPWLNNLLDTVYGNYTYAKDTLEKALPNIVITPLEGTYLMWIDFSAYLKADEVIDFMEKKCGLAFDFGEWFGGSRFGTYIRMNLATSREMVESAVNKILTNIT